MSHWNKRKRPPTIEKLKNEYYNEKQKYIDIWRPVILSRDGYNCRGCHQSASLQVAHITSCLEFTKVYGFIGIKYSFREDNLVTLCSVCHEAHHRYLVGVRISEKAKEKALAVGVIFNHVLQHRSWRLPGELGLKKETEMDSPPMHPQVVQPRHGKKVKAFQQNKPSDYWHRVQKRREKEKRKQEQGKEVVAKLQAIQKKRETERDT